MPKSLDKNITTLNGIRHATQHLNGENQIYVQLTGYNDDDSALIEITEIQMVLPKDENEEAYLVFRCK
jgi:hypothetical protein